MRKLNKVPNTRHCRWSPFTRKERLRFGDRMWVASTYRKTWKTFGGHISSMGGVRTYRVAAKHRYNRKMRQYYKRIAKDFQYGNRENLPPNSTGQCLSQLHETW